MREQACARRWEAEAFHEGRLHGADRASWERHASRCSACKGELSSMRELRQALRGLPVPSIDDLGARRRRQQLLAVAFEEPTPRRRRGVVWVAFAAALALVFAVVGFAGRGSVQARVADAPPATSQARATAIVAATGTRWSRQSAGTTDHVDLVEGELAIEVDHAAPSARLTVTVPDGQIEDVGTRFVVQVHDGATRRIVVSEGAVIFRRHDGDAVRLDAPATWTRPSNEPALTSSIASAASPDRSPPEVPAVKPLAPSKRVPARAEGAATLFAEANEARRSGDHARALALHRRLQQDFASSREAHASYGIEGRLLLDRGDAAAALASFEAYRQRGHGPLDESVLAGRASALERLGRNEDARAAWRLLLASFPDSPYGEHARRQAAPPGSP
jgi:TolA-binding protein